MKFLTNQNLMLAFAIFSIISIFSDVKSYRNSKQPSTITEPAEPSVNPEPSVKPETTVNPETPVNPELPVNPSDAVHSRITDYIKSLAEAKMKSSNILAKKKISGVLPEGFPKEIIKKALETRNNKSTWRPILGLPTEIYRICLYPSAKVNYNKWCNNSFFGTKNKSDSKIKFKYSLFT